jgi:phage terminase large subunit
MATLLHRYNPYGTAKDLINSRDNEILYGGAAGTGKSRACLEKLHAMCMLNPDMRGLMVRKTLVSLTGSGVQTYRKHVASEALQTGMVKWFGGSGEEPAGFKYSNGSTISVVGMDKAGKIQSAEYDVIYVQEATELTENDWEFCTMRLRNGRVSFQQLMADCNPDMPTHWLNERVTQGKTSYIKSKHEDNPMLFNQETMELTEFGRDYMKKLDALTGVRYQRYRLGNWVAAEGLVYETYDPELHIRDSFAKPPMEWKLYLSVDFGFTNPFVCQFWLEDNDGRLYLWKEIYQTKTLVEDHAKVILANLDRKPAAIICDHDAEDRATLSRHLGMPTIAAKKTVSDGLQAVASRLTVLNDGKSRLYICRDAVINKDKELSNDKKPTSTLEEIVGYVWNKDKDAPLKENDHGMDAMRYMIAHKDLTNEMKLRVLTW